MIIELKKLTNDAHLLRCTRKDGSVEEAELETKSLLVHDLTHLAYETEAGLKKSFWGSVAAGKSFAELRDDNAPEGELMQTEMTVGPLQGIVQGRASVEGFVPQVKQYQASVGVTPAAFLNEEFIARVVERFKKLYGEWKSTPFGETMRIDYAE